MASPTIFKNYNDIKTTYNQIWLILIVIGIGALIMQLISGNLKSNELQSFDNVNNFECTQTKDQELELLPKESLKTDMSLGIIDIEKLVQTAQTKNSIPQITRPKFSTIQEIGKCLQDDDEVVVLTADNQSKLYPKPILAQHLVVNDMIGNTPVLVSYCVLCDSVKVYERVLQGEVLTFGTTGLLYKNNDLFYDNKTESLWSQYSGEAVIGEYSKSKLSPLSFRIITFQKAKEEFGDSEILSFDTGFRKNYQDRSFLSFAQNNQFIGPIENQNDEFSPKTKIIGFELDSQQFVINREEITDKKEFSFQSKTFTTYLDGDELTLLYNKNPINFTQSFWYVWFDFYPNTKILESTPKNI